MTKWCGSRPMERYLASKAENSTVEAEIAAQEQDDSFAMRASVPLEFSCSDDGCWQRFSSHHDVRLDMEVKAMTERKLLGEKPQIACFLHFYDSDAPKPSTKIDNAPVDFVVVGLAARARAAVELATVGPAPVDFAVVGLADVTCPPLTLTM